MSLPTWAAWIEIVCNAQGQPLRRSLPTWAAWIEIKVLLPQIARKLSLPTWAAWIEIQNRQPVSVGELPVAAHLGSVD